MSGFTDAFDLGFFPLQDHASAQDGTPVAARQMLVGGRITRMTDPADTNAPDETMLEYGKAFGMGTLGDVHPWFFWQTRERSKRGMGSWAQAIPTLAVDADGYYGTISGQPIRDDQFRNDTRYRSLSPGWPTGLSRVPRGAITLTVAGTEESGQHELALWTDPRLVAPNVSGPGECGTIVVDMQPTHELCMDGEEVPGIGGRHARLQSLIRVIAVKPDEVFGDAAGGARGNTIALNFANSGADRIPNYGAFFGYIDGSAGTGGPITGGGNSSGGGPITGVPSGGQNTGIPPGTILQSQLGRGESSFGAGAHGLDDGEGADEEFAPKDFGTFSRHNVGSHGIGLMAHLGAYGPLHPGAGADKHRHGFDRDGHPINAAHVSTNAFFYQDVSKDAPISFEGDYPHPKSLPIPAKAHCSYDAISQHAFGGQQRSGLWRFWCETPDVVPGPPPSTPTGDPPTGEPPADPPSAPPTGKPTGGGPTTGGGGPSGPGGQTGPTTGGPRKPKGPITPNPGGKRFPGHPPTPDPPGGPITGGGQPPSGPQGPITGGGSGGQPSVPCKIPQAPPTGPITGGRGGRPSAPLVPGVTGTPGPGSSASVFPTSGSAGSSGSGPGVGTGQVFGRHKRGGVAGAGTGSGVGPAGGARRRADSAKRRLQNEPINVQPMVLPSGSRLYNTGGGEIIPRGPTIGTPVNDPRAELGRWAGRSQTTNLEEIIPGVVEHVGSSTKDDVGLYTLFRPMAQGFASVNFRPQLTVNGYPSFEHNPQMPAPMYFNDERTRPQVLAMRAWGAQSSGDGDWNYVEKPSHSRARGGTGNGGVIFQPPRFELEDYYGVGPGVQDVSDVTSTQATTSYVLAAPGVSFALGTPSADGTLGANAVTISRDPDESFDPLIIKHNGIEVLRAYTGSDGDVVKLAGGAVHIPSGGSGARPAAPAVGMVRVNTDATDEELEFYGAAEGWQSLQSVTDVVLEGEETGDVTSVAMAVGGGRALAVGDIGVPVTHACKALYVAASWLAASSSGDYTLRLKKRTPTTGFVEVATFTISTS